MSPPDGDGTGYDGAGTGSGGYGRQADHGSGGRGGQEGGGGANAFGQRLLRKGRKVVPFTTHRLEHLGGELARGMLVHFHLVGEVERIAKQLEPMNRSTFKRPTLKKNPRKRSLEDGPESSDRTDRGEPAADSDDAVFMQGTVVGGPPGGATRQQALLAGAGGAPLAGGDSAGAPANQQKRKIKRKAKPVKGSPKKVKRKKSKKKLAPGEKEVDGEDFEFD